MFSQRTSKLTQRALAAAGQIRSFLLLEDDRDVDWEVDAQEVSGDVHATAAALHERQLQRPARSRRPGSTRAAVQPCLSPVRSVGRHERVRPHITERAAHRGRPSCGRSPSR